MHGFQPYWVRRMSNKPISGTRRKIPDWEIDEDFDLDLPKSVFEKIRRRDTKPLKHGSRKDIFDYSEYKDK